MKDIKQIAIECGIEVDEMRLLEDCTIFYITEQTLKAFAKALCVEQDKRIAELEERNRILAG